MCSFSLAYLSGGPVMKVPQGGMTLIAGILLFSPGCWGSGDNLPREPVSGKVLFGGQPLDRGRILFYPVDTATGTPTSGLIQGGSFSIGRDAGPVPGDYKVTISSPTSNLPTPAKGQGLPDATALEEERIPPQYNADSQLTAKVAKGAPNHFEFALDTTGPPHRPVGVLGPRGRRRPVPPRSQR
jgi:hypothetical protein